MGMHKIAKMPSPEELKEEMPLSEEAKQIKAARDKEIRDVFTGASDKFLVIIGPCSADNETAVMDYLGRLARVQKDLADKLLIIPRIYTNKPRTTGDGYKGMVHQPDPEKRPSMADGLHAIRHLHMRVLKETGFSTADEMLYPDNVSYLDDIMSYIAVGARSVENQQHRLVSSGCHVPVGMKNPTLRYAQLRSGSSARSRVHHARLGSKDRRKPMDSHNPARCCQQAWSVPAKLSL